MMNSTRHFIFRLTTLLISFLLCSTTQAQETECKRLHSVVWENDAIADDDGGYTNGFAYNWGYKSIACGQSWTQKLNSWFTAFSQLHGQSHEETNAPFSYQLVHAIFTPSDIENHEVDPDDRPHTGLMYGALKFNHHNEISTTHYELLLGAVGPITKAAEIQEFIHEVIGTNNPNGWEHQTKNEAVFRLGMDKNWKIYNGAFLKNHDSDLIAMSDAKIGNLSSDIGAGLSYRIGRNLNNTFPYHNLTPGRSIPSFTLTPGDWNIFFTIYGNYVFNDITIEGNTRKDSHGVPLINEQFRYVAGGYYQFKRYGFSASIQQSSEQFEGVDEDTLFLTLGLSY